MRKPRDFDAELKALDEKAKQLKARKVAQLGELVIATGADSLPTDVLAGALLTAIENRDMVAKEEWRARGEGWFQRATRGARSFAVGRANMPAPSSSPLPTDRGTRAD